MRAVCARFRVGLFVVVGVLAAACQPAADGGKRGGPDAGADADADAAIAVAPVARPALCDRDGDDVVRDVFCAQHRPTITSLRDLEKQLRVSMPVQDMFWGGRYGKIVDPFGHEWGINQQLKEQSPEETQTAADEFFAKRK